MKTKKLRLFILCLLFTGISWEIPAQTHLDAQIKKCETLKSVNMDVIKNKQKTDKEAEIKTVNIRITNDTKLVNEFLDAFKKDASNAEQAMFRKRKESDEINYYQCQFPKQTYTIIVKEAGNANVTVGNHHSGRFSMEPLRLEQQKQRLEQQKEQMKQHQERTKQQKEQHKERMKQQKEQHKQQMKQHQERMKQRQERMKQYKLNGLDSILQKHNIIADSLILKSSSYFNSINWDSITSQFGKDIDSMVNKLGVGWDKVLEKYEFE